MKRKISESGEELCPVCQDVVRIYAFGECDHPICYRCSIRMRVLCDQMYCAICRSDLPKVAFTRSGDAKFDTLNLSKFKLHHKQKIFFEDEALKKSFFDIQEHRCQVCQEPKIFRGFPMLRDHMRKEHSMFSCDLCLKYLKIFSSDRKFYDRKGLGEHRRLGDADDSSYKGHPLCKFCDERYFDNDELLKHLRKHHYYCHFCEADGISNEYYDTYPYLRDHFRDAHYLCEEDDCAVTEFTSAFRDEIDFKAHKAAVHHKNLKKAMAKAARTLDIDFNIASRGGSGAGRDDYGESGRRGAYGRRDRGMSRRDREQQREENEVQRALTASLNVATSSSISVVDPTLLRPAAMHYSNSDPRLDRHHTTYDSDDSRRDRGAQSKTEKPKMESRTRVVEKMDRHKSKRSPEVQKRTLYEESKKREDLAQPVGAPVKGMHDDSDSESDSGDFRAFSKVEPKEPEPPKPEPPPEQKPVSSMADNVKLANNFSVQLGAMEVEDFPTLGGAKPRAVVDDFPALGGGGKPVAQAPPKAKSFGHKKTTSPVDDFPTLGGGRPQTNSKSKPKSAGSQWTKGAPAATNKPVTTVQTITKPKPQVGTLITLGSTKSVSSKPNSVSNHGNKPISASSNSHRQHARATNENSDDFPSLSSIGGALLSGKNTGNTSEVLAKYTSSAPPPATSNVKIVREKPQADMTAKPTSRPKFSSQNDFPDLSDMNESRDFPSLGGRKSKHATSGATSWGPKTKPNFDAPQPKAEANTGILKLKTKAKTNKTPAPAPVIDSSLDPESYSDKSSDNTNKGGSSSSASKKNKKSSQSQIASDESSSDSLKFKEVNAQKDKKKQANVVEDPVLAFLKHNQEVTQEQIHLKNSEFDSQADSKQSKKKKKKKGKKASPDDDKEDEEFFPGAASSQLNGSTTGRSDKENVPRSNYSNSSSVAAAEKLADTSNYRPKVEVITAKPSSGDFPSFHEKSTKAVDLQDFPALGGATGRGNKAAPPGLQKSKEAKAQSLSKPPPGLGKPPGFASSGSSAPPGFNSGGGGFSLGGIANGILTSQSGLPNAPVIALEFSKPHNFDQRNRSLITDIHRHCLSEVRFAEFKRFSGEFRRNMLDGKSYYNECCNVLGKTNFEEIFPELLVLLPDIGKQQELLKAHRDSREKKSASKGSKNSAQEGYPFSECPLCKQVLLQRDESFHMDVHMENAEFPSLGQGVDLNSALGNGSWGVKT